MSKAVLWKRAPRSTLITSKCNVESDQAAKAPTSEQLDKRDMQSIPSTEKMPSHRFYATSVFFEQYCRGVHGVFVELSAIRQNFCRQIS